MKAGEGERARDVEEYLKNILEAILRERRTPTPAEGRSDESEAMVVILSRRKCPFPSALSGKAI